MIVTRSLATRDRIRLTTGLAQNALRFQPEGVSAGRAWCYSVSMLILTVPLVVTWYNTQPMIAPTKGATM